VVPQAPNIVRGFFDSYLIILYHGKDSFAAAPVNSNTSNAMGGISRFTFQMDAGLSHTELLTTFEKTTRIFFQ